jgi:membrane-associated phospholipid phosphatase
VSALLTVDSYGFPSEHLAALGALLTVGLWPWRPTRWRTGVVRYGMAAVALALIGAGQTVLLVEYPSDTLAGMAVGVVWALVVAVALDTRLRNRADLVTGPS